MLFFKTVKVAGDGSCLAASYTPPAQAYEKTFTVYPAEFHDWAAGAGIPQPPTSILPAAAGQARHQHRADRPARRWNCDHQHPGAGARERARRLHAGVGRRARPRAAGSSSRAAIARVADGILGVWRTDGLPPGDYALRLRVTTPDGVPVEAKVVVNLAR